MHTHLHMKAFEKAYYSNADDDVAGCGNDIQNLTLKLYFASGC